TASEPAMVSGATEGTSTETVMAAPENIAVNPSPVLNERQEMERLRRQRNEERERGAPATLSSAALASTTMSSENNPTHVEAPKKEIVQSTKGVLVTTPSFLPRCEADTLAAAMPLENSQESEAHGAKDPAFGGAGYRLGGSTSIPPAANTSSLPPGFLLQDTDGDAEAEWEMMQEAIAMSLQNS
ncbi:hypothetical protein BGZ65_012613, partial [Modicella reniformis]